MDDKELEAIVQKMIDAGESEDTIAAVIKEYEAQAAQEEKQYQPISEPTTWGEGVMNSLTPESLGGSGEVGRAMKKGAQGFIQGAVLDLPSSIASGLESVANIAMSPESGEEELNRIWAGLKEAPGQMWEATKKAGTEPEEFGRMVGQLTGQPALTGGLSKGYRASAPTMGRGLETLGSLAVNNKIVTPFMPDMFTPRIVGMGERGVGWGLRELGRKMQRGSDSAANSPWEVVSDHRVRNEGTIPPEGPGTRMSTRAKERRPVDSSVTYSRAPQPELNPVGMGSGGENLLTGRTAVTTPPPNAQKALPGMSHPKRITIKSKSFNSNLGQKLRDMGYKFEKMNGGDMSFTLSDNLDSKKNFSNEIKPIDNAITRFIKDEKGEIDLDVLKTSKFKMLNSAEHIKETAMMPFRRLQNRIPKIIEKDYSGLPDDTWRTQFAETIGKQTSLELKEQAEWARKQNFEFPEQRNAMQEISDNLNKLANDLDSTPNTPQKLDILRAIRDFFSEDSNKFNLK